MLAIQPGTLAALLVGIASLAAVLVNGVNALSTRAARLQQASEAAKDRAHQLELAQGEREHQVALAREERLHERRSDSYITALNGISRQLAWMARTHPRWPLDGIEPIERPTTDERLRSAVSVQAFGTSEVRALLEKWGVAALEFDYERGVLDNLLSGSTDPDFLRMVSAGNITEASQRMKIQDARSHAYEAAEEVRKAARAELQV